MQILRYCLAVLVPGIPALAQGSLPAGTELRAYVNDSCIVADEPYYLPDSDDQIMRSFSIAGLIVGKLAHALIGGAIRATASQLESVSKQRDMYFVAAKDVNLYWVSLDQSPNHQWTTQLACATVVAANFDRDNSDCTHLYIPKVISTVPAEDGDLAAATTREDDSVENILRRANVCVLGATRSVYEFRFEYSEDGTAFRVENAGLWMNSLLSTDSKKSKRTVVYTIELAEPAVNSEMQVLTSAWLHIGEVTAGMDTDQDIYASRSDWLRVPPLSESAAAVYQRDTAIHQDVYAEIEALERAITRNRRLAEGLERRMTAASETVQVALKTELDEIEFRTLHAESLLDAKRLEYEDLPQSERHYMPITIRISIIESRSEKRALKVLAAYLEENSSRYADAASDALGVERSLDTSEPAEQESAARLQEARTNYFDARIALEEASSTEDANLVDAEQNLTQAQDVYNAARSELGIPAI